MIRKLMASSAMLALMTAGAISLAQAQTEPAQTEEPAVVQQDAAGAPATEMAADADATLTPEEPTIATAFLGQSVFSSEDPESDNIGEVNDLIISDDGMITHAVIGVGGFLGIGEKNVAVPFDELQVVEQEGDIRLVYASSREQLEAAEEFDRATYDPGARFAEEQAAMVPADGADPLAPAPLPADDMAATEQPVEEPVTAEADPAAPAEEPAMAEAEPAATAEEPVTAEADAAAPAEEPAMAEAEPAASVEEPMTAEADAAAPAEEPAMADAEPAAEEEVAAAEPDLTAGAAGETSFLDYSADQVRATTLIGKEIYGPEEESIGEVSDLVLQEDGETHAALVDVGGFLGVGEKRVAIPFEQIQMSQPAEDGGEPRLTIAMTKEELEQVPAFEDDTMGSADVAATTTEPVEEPAAADQQAADAGAEATTPEADMAAGGDVSAEELIGTAVYGANEENLGEVGDVVFGDTGTIEAVVVDVGGFLGIGEKPVAVQFDALNVQKDTNGDVRLMLNTTQEQLETAPSYDETAAIEAQPVQ